MGGASSSSGVDCLAAFAGSEMQPPPRKVRFAREKGHSWRSWGAEGAYGHSTRGGTQGVARRSKPNTEETEETAQPLSGPAPSPLPVRCFVGPHAGVEYQAGESSSLFNPTGEASPGGETSLLGAAEHPSEPATEGGGSAGGYQVAPDPSHTPSSQERAPLLPQLTSARDGRCQEELSGLPIHDPHLGPAS